MTWRAVRRERRVGMLRALRADTPLYFRLIGMQIRAQMQYKADVALNIGTYFLVTAAEFAQIALVFGAFATLGGWSAGEVALLYSITSISFGLAELFGAGLDIFSDLIRKGEFDRVLLRPVGALMQVATSDFKLRRLGRLTQGAITFGVALWLLGGLRWTPDKLLVLPLGILSGSAVFISVLLLGATICFWSVETTELTNILTYGGREMLSWPLTVYSEVFQRLFVFFVPLAFGTFIPACYLLDRPLPFGLPAALAFAAPLVALVFAVVARVAWGFGVRHYQSTGS
jgi:viologen exporter family transport system permease protein